MDSVIAVSQSFTTRTLARRLSSNDSISGDEDLTWSRKGRRAVARVFFSSVVIMTPPDFPADRIF